MLNEMLVKVQELLIKIDVEIEGQYLGKSPVPDNILLFQSRLESDIMSLKVAVEEVGLE